MPTGQLPVKMIPALLYSESSQRSFEDFSVTTFHPQPCLPSNQHLEPHAIKKSSFKILE